MIDPERIGETLADQTTGPLPSGLGAGGLAARHQRRARRRRAAGGVAALIVVAGGAFTIPRLGGEDARETVAETVTEDVATPTTEDPVKVEEQTAGQEAQDAALADGAITEDEYSEAVQEYRACSERLDEADCYDFHIDEIDDLISELGGPTPPTVPTGETETVESILVPGGDFTVAQVNTTWLDTDPGFIALATTELGASGPLLRVTLDYGQAVDAPDGITELDTPGQATVFVNRIGGLDVAVEGIGVDAATIEAVAAQITVEDRWRVTGPTEWPEGFATVPADEMPLTGDVVIADGPIELSLLATDGSTLLAQDLIASARARSATERVTEVGLVTDRVTFVAHGSRLYLLYVAPEHADLVIGSLAPVEPELLRDAHDLLDRAVVWDEWLAATPLPEGHGLDAFRDGLTIDPPAEAIGAHEAFQCAWIDRWVETGDAADLVPLASSDTWPTADLRAEADDGRLVLGHDIIELLLGEGETRDERATDPAAELCARIG